MVVHDFDLAAPVWRAADLTGVWRTQRWDDFAAGYTEIRRFGGSDAEALLWFSMIGIIANLRFHLADKPTFRGTESLRDGWVASGLADLRRAAEQLL
jgi:hypothetical protein